MVKAKPCATWNDQTAEQQLVVVSFCWVSVGSSQILVLGWASLFFFLRECHHEVVGPLGVFLKWLIVFLFIVLCWSAFCLGMNSGKTCSNTFDGIQGVQVHFRSNPLPTFTFFFESASCA